MTALTISDISIRQDAEGRYCLNDLHRAAVASGANERTKEPGKFFASQQTVDLVAELTDTQNLGIAPVNTIKGGNQQGTFAVKELVYAYAMWISPKFHLTVIRAYDAIVTQPVQAIPHTFAEALRLAAETIERNEQLALENRAQADALADAAPKVQALDRISASKHTLTLTEVAKVLVLKMDEMTTLMHAKKWIYRLNGSWVGYDYHIKNGDLAYKEAKYTDENGQQVIKPYCHVTQQGLVKLALMFGVTLGQGEAA